MLKTLSDYFRLPEGAVGELRVDAGYGDAGFFQLGPEITCFGQCALGVSPTIENAGFHDVADKIRQTGSLSELPFDPAQVIDNLRLERYESVLMPQRQRVVAHELVRRAYYAVRELLPISARRHLQKVYFSDWRKRRFPRWPVDFTVDLLEQEILKLCMESAGRERVPFIWFWPEGARSCLIMTHDVETAAGRDFMSQLMDIDDAHGIKASFQLVPEKRYELPESYLCQLRKRGFECNVHDLNHDGRLYHDREEFRRRAAKINEYIQKYQSRGFRAGAMYRNVDWYDSYEFSYDMSVPNVAHLEPKRGGCCTVMPYFIGKILELPLTATQDYSLFHILNDYSLELWKRQLSLIREKNGLMSFITHPDYLIDRKNRQVYESLLSYLETMIGSEEVWSALPGDVDRWWRARKEMKLVNQDGAWKIMGPECSRARIAYAVLNEGRLTYEMTSTSSPKEVRV